MAFLEGTPILFKALSFGSTRRIDVHFGRVAGDHLLVGPFRTRASGNEEQLNPVKSLVRTEFLEFCQIYRSMFNHRPAPVFER